MAKRKHFSSPRRKKINCHSRMKNINKPFSRLVLWFFSCTEILFTTMDLKSPFFTTISENLLISRYFKKLQVLSLDDENSGNRNIFVITFKVQEIGGRKIVQQVLTDRCKGFNLLRLENFWMILHIITIYSVLEKKNVSTLPLSV